MGSVQSRVTLPAAPAKATSTLAVSGAADKTFPPDEEHVVSLVPASATLIRSSKIMGSMSFGKYKLIAELGHGGMADVFLAVQAGPAGSGFRKLTVVKRLRQNLADEPEFIAMLVDEARIAARLNHPNVVQTNEVGNVGNQYFIAMEYLDGQPLHRIQHRSLQRGKTGGSPTLTSDQQCLILMDVLAGLHHAHELTDYDGTPLEIVHRDMTPQNVFVTYEGQVKVVDFGIAKAAGRASETRQGVVKGKVRYMAPEQAIGLSVSRRSDVFAVGIMLWEAALSRRMWKDKDDMQIVQALVSGDLPPMPREIDPSVPEMLDRICRHALALRPEDRHPTAEALRQDIEQYLAESGKLVEARRQLGPTVIELFKDKRAEIRGIIEKQLASVEEAPSSASDLSVLQHDSLSERSLPPSFTTNRATTMGVSVVEGGPPPTTVSGVAGTPAKQRFSLFRGGIYASVIVALLFGAAAAWKTFAARPVAAAPREPKVEEINLRLNANVASARITLDDRPLQPVPVDMRVPKDERSHVVRVEAEGYEPQTAVVTFGQDVGKTFELARRAETPAASSTVLKHPPPEQHPRPTVAAAPWRPPSPVKTAEPKAADPKPEQPTPPPVATPTPSPEPTNKRLQLDKEADPWATKHK